MSVRIGVALYSDGTPYSREGNFACEHRGRPFSFATASDLPGQTLWITNCDLKELIDVGLHRNPKIAQQGYFRTRLNQMVHELGASSLSTEQLCALLAEIIGNAALMIRRQLGFTQYPTRGIAQGVAQLYGYPQAPSGSAVRQVAEHAYQRYTACERERRFEKAEIFSFWMPRHAWAKKLLSEPIPGNDNITLIPPHNLPEMGRDAGALVDWATENNIPLFARVKILGLEETVGRLMNYGSGARDMQMKAQGGGQYSARNLREWCALPELETLVQAGDVQIQQVATANAWQRSGLHCHGSKISTVSYSYGLVAENLWTGLTRKPDASNEMSRTLSTAWLQAVDRMGCMRVAEKLHNIGMEVINFGSGRVTVACPPSVRALIPQAALEEGLMYPPLEGLTPYKPRSSDPAHVMQHLINSRDYARLTQVDHALLKELEGAVET